MTPQEFLKSQGIEIQSTVLISYIDGQLRNVDLVKLLEGYAQQCKDEYDFNEKCEDMS